MIKQTVIFGPCGREITMTDEIYTFGCVACGEIHVYADKDKATEELEKWKQTECSSFEEHNPDGFEIRSAEIFITQ